MRYLYLAAFLHAAILVATAPIDRTSSQQYISGHGWPYQHDQLSSTDPSSTTYDEAMLAQLAVMSDDTGFDLPHNNFHSSDHSYTSSLFPDLSHSLPMGHNQLDGMQYFSLPPGNQDANVWQAHNLGLPGSHGDFNHYNPYGFGPSSSLPLIHETNSAGALPFAMSSNQGVHLQQSDFHDGQHPPLSWYDFDQYYGNSMPVASDGTRNNPTIQHHPSFIQPSLLHANDYQDRPSHQIAQSSSTSSAIPSHNPYPVVLPHSDIDDSRSTATTTTAKRERKTGHKSKKPHGTAHGPHSNIRSPSFSTNTTNKRKLLLRRSRVQPGEAIVDMPIIPQHDLSSINHSPPPPQNGLTHRRYGMQPYEVLASVQGPSELPVHCPKCDKPFKKEQALAGHMKSHNPNWDEIKKGYNHNHNRKSRIKKT